MKIKTEPDLLFLSYLEEKTIFIELLSRKKKLINKNIILLYSWIVVK